MSGIVGILNLDHAPVDSALLTQMTDSIKYRGPDTQEIWVDVDAGFGHTMLRTTFEAATERQPLTINRKFWLTADARIDGRSNLIRELQSKLDRDIQLPLKGPPSEPREPNDAELILLAYEAWGEDCVQHLVGDFSFAIWDSVKRRLFCGRDHFGVKQFYYSLLSNVFLFSNTLNCLRQHPRVSQNLNETAIGDYLLFGLNQDLTSTAFADIQRLPPASTLTVSSNGVEIRKFWTPVDDTAIRFPRCSDYSERFMELFSQAVGDRLRTNKVSISMSGGLDSTSIAAMARDVSREPADLHGFVVVYDRLIPDEERRFSTLAASALGIRVTHLPADDYLLYEEKIPDQLQQPEPFLMNPTSAQFNELLGSMAKHGRVALSGWDGDALMNEPANSALAATIRNRNPKQFLWNVGWFLSRKRLPPILLRTKLRRLIASHPTDTSYPEWINTAFLKRLNLAKRWQEVTTKHSNVRGMRPYAIRALNSPTWAPLFEGYDAGTNGLQLEVRHPMLDVRLVEYLLSIPAIPWCVDKEILRVSMKRKLPEAILKRPKTPLAGFPALRLVQESSVRFVENFEPAPRLKEFVTPGRYQLAGERNVDRLYMNLRPFGLNHWLMHSLPKPGGNLNNERDRGTHGTKAQEFHE